MYLDKLCLFSDAQSIQNTGVCTDKMDIGAITSQDFGAGEDPELVITVDTAVTRGAGACTVTFAFVTDGDSALGSPTTLASSGAVAKTDLTAGAVAWRCKVPSATYEQYIGVTYTFSAAADTGAFTAALYKDFGSSKKAYPDGLTIT